LIPAALKESLRKRHGEPQRHYHTWAHVEALLGHYRNWVRYLNRPGPVLWALYWHDAIYDPRSRDNEELSAQLLEREAVGHLSPQDIGFAAAIIRATATHTVPEGLSASDAGDLALFLDMDLSILGAPEAVYDTYEQAIRAEYAFVPEEAYRTGRTAILKGFLERPRLYFTDIAHAEWDAAARSNLTRAVRALEQGS
jgi:predicted metal-dependent HD superfamily phosphohydrolase